LDRNQMWDQCPTTPRWAAFHTEMCELLHTSLKFLPHLRGTGRHLQASKSCCTGAGRFRTRQISRLSPNGRNRRSVVARVGPRQRQLMPHSRPLPTARAFKSDHQVGASQENGRDPRPSLVLCAEIERDSSSQSDAVRRTRLQPSIPMVRIVSRYNQRGRQVGFEDESHGERFGCNAEPVEAYQTTMDVPGATLDSVWS